MENEPQPGPSDHSLKDKNEWKPDLNMENRSPSTNAVKRIRTDLKQILKNDLPGIYCIPDENYSMICHALIVGPFDTPYEGGFFHFLINCPDDYPHSPPKVMLM
jgi:ubiquitin-conjugating enzyme E2 Z